MLRDNSEELKHKKRQNEATLGWHDMLLQLGRRLGNQMCHSCMFLKARCPALGCTSSLPPSATSWAAPPAAPASLDAACARDLLVNMVILRQDPVSGEEMVPSRETEREDATRAKRVGLEMKTHIQHRLNLTIAVQTRTAEAEGRAPHLGPPPTVIELDAAWSQQDVIDRMEEKVLGESPVASANASRDRLPTLDSMHANAQEARASIGEEDSGMEVEVDVIPAGSPEILAVPVRIGAFHTGVRWSTVVAPPIEMCMLQAQQLLATDFNARQRARFAAYVEPLAQAGTPLECLVCPRTDTHDPVTCPYYQVLAQTQLTSLVLMPVPQAILQAGALLFPSATLLTPSYTLDIPQPAVTAGRTAYSRLRLTWSLLFPPHTSQTATVFEAIAVGS